MLKLAKSFTVLFLFLGAILSANLWSSEASAATIGITGSLPRDLTAGAVQITLTISGISTEQNTKGGNDPADAVERAKARLKIYLNDESTAVPWVSDPASTVEFFAREYQDHTEEPESAVAFKYTYYVEIVETRTNALKEKATGGKLNVKAEFFLGGDSVATMTTSQTLIQDSYVINKAPVFDPTAPIVGSHKSLTIKWTPETEVDALSGTTASKKTPSQMLIFLIDSELVTEASMEAKKYSGTSDADSVATCKLSLTADDVQSCVTCDEGIYLLEAKQTGVIFKTVAASNGSVSFSNLENDRRYFALLQYEPDGVKRTQCLVGLPSRNYSLTELNGAGEATVVDFRCFIATAAYGSPTHAKIKYFRKFRDEILLTNPVGKTFVHLYYKYSPPAADFISTHPWLKSVVRSALEIPAQLLESADEWY